MIERFIPGAGGVENVAWQVAHELDRQGQDLTVIAREASPQRSVRVAITPAPTFWQPMRVTLFSKRAARLHRENAFDVVHSFARTRHQDLYRAGGGSHLDYLRRNHEGIGRALRHVSPRHRVLLDTELEVFRRSQQRIQCASRLVADAIMQDHQIGPERILLLPNAVDAQAFSAASAVSAGAALRAQIDPEAELVWLLPGSGWRRKGLDTALQALARTPGAGIHLWVAGRDEGKAWRSRVDSLGLTRRVRFLGEREDMPAVYQAADVAVLPTRYDPFANVTAEASAAGLPIVTSGSNGAAEWFGDAIQVVSDPLDVPGFVAALKQLENTNEREQRGQSLARFARGLDWASHVRALRDEYAAIVGRRERGRA